MGVFGDLNKVEVMGNITQDLELRYTPNGSQVTNFSVATNRSYKLGEEWQEEVTFHNIVVWGNDAEQLSQRAQKGTRVYVQGRLQTRTWDDADGKKNYKTEIVAEKVILLDRYTKPEGSESPAGAPSAPAPRKAAPPKSAPKPKPADEEVIDPDDLPF